MKTQSALINPVTLPPRESWTPAEELLVECMSQGVRCIVGDTRPSPDIDKNKQPGVSIRSEMIRFFALGGCEEFPVKGSNIYVQGALVPDRLNLLFAEVPYVLSFMSCYFTQAITIRHSKCRAIYLNASHLARGLSGDGAQIDGSIVMRENFSAGGEVRIVNANIGGGLFCENGKFNNPAGCALNATGARVGTDVFMSNGFSAERSVLLTSAVIGGNLQCHSGTFKGKGAGFAIHANGIEIRRNLVLANNFSTEGSVYLSNADIGGNMECAHASFQNESKEKSVLFADGLKVRGDLLIQNSKFKGTVRLFGANVGGNMNCTGSSFHGDGEAAIAASRLTVGGNLSLQAGFTANGEVRLTAANIGGSFFGDGSFNSNNNRRALNADRITIKGNLYLRKEFTAEGGVRFPAANIGGSLYVDESAFTGKLNAKAATIKNSLRLRKVRGSEVNLSFASVDVLNDDQESRDGLKFNLYGFSYARFADQEDAQSRADWLDNRPKNAPFSPQPFEQAAKVLFAMGNEDGARQILLAKERQVTEHGNMSTRRRYARKAWDIFAGYGYLLRRTLAWSAVVIAAGWGVFFAADRHSYIVPHQPIVVAHADYRSPPMGSKCADIKRPTERVECLFPKYPRFVSLLYSADVFIPFFALHQEPYWYPQLPKPDLLSWANIWRILLSLWYWLEIAAGWLLTSLFVLSVTGLLKPRQTSGDK